MQSNGLIYYDCQQVIKNLLFVAKVIYLISPESDLEENTKEEEGEKDVGKNEEGEKEDEDEEQEDEEDEQQQQQIINEQHEEEEQQLQKIIEENQPPSLSWLIKKLTLLAKREAACTPKVPLKVSC